MKAAGASGVADASGPSAEYHEPGLTGAAGGSLGTFHI